jgi:DNA-binding NarL/FixJ family response regulator
MYRVLIVDDHESMCDSLERELSCADDFTVVGRLSNADHAGLFCEKLCPDLVFMDICTEGGASGLNAIETLRENFPDIKIIAMSGFDEITYAPRAEKAGAHAFITKTKSLCCFTETALGVMQGENYYPEEKTLSFPRGEIPLTSREMEVLQLMCKHMTNSEIAAELYISENTVKYHKKNMLAKTGFKTSIDLAFHVITHGWINPLF